MCVNWLYIPVVEKYQGSGTDLDIWVGVSSDFGDNWTFNRIDDSGGTEFNPWLQVDQTTGTVNVLYYTTDGDVGTGNDDVRPRLAMSNDGGATWTRNFLSTQQSNESVGTPANGNYGGDYLEYIGLGVRDGTAHGLWASRYPAGGTDLDAFTANAAFVSGIGDNRLFIGGSGGIDDSFLVQQSPANPAFLEVFVDGVREFTGLGATLDHIIFNPGGGINTFNIGSLTGISSVTINGTNDIDTYDIVSLGLNAPLSIVLGGGDDTVTLGSSPFASQLIQSPVTVFGDAGNDTLYLGSNNADSIDANITFNGGASVGVVGDRIVFNDFAPSYNVSYDIAPTSVTRDGFNLPRTVSYSNTDGIVINAGSGSDTVNLANGLSATVDLHVNGGNDVLNVGGGNMSGYFPQIFDGGDGDDRITFDNHLDSTNRIWDMRNNEVIFGGLISLFTNSFESVGVLGGSGQDEFDFKGVLGQGFNVDGGLNSDTFVLGYEGSVFFSNAVTLQGGDGGDVFTINDAAVSAFTTLSMDGGDFVNTMYVNEPLATGYYLGPGYFTPKVGASTQGTFGFGNILTTVITGTSGDNDFTIYSAGVSLGTYTINGGSGNDSFVLAPQLSGYSFKGLTINGQPGTDTFTLDAGGLFTNESYTIGTNALTIARGGVDFDTVTITSMDSVTLNCGLGNDTIYMSQYSAGIPVTVNGGIGDDTMNVGGGDLAANITNIAAFAFSGHNGHDTFNLNNGNRTDQWSYTNNTASIQASDLSTGYSITLGHSAIEQLNVNAGSGIDVMTLTAVPAGQTLAFHGGDGGDAVNLPGDLATIQGPVYFYGDGGTNNINHLSNSATNPTTVHLDQSSLGSFPGDNFFPAGASLHFENVNNMGVRLGSGADTVYAQPNATATLNIQGGSPTTAPGDTLNLDLANAVNYVITPTSPTSGNVTSDNLQTLTFSGFETIPNAPQFVEAISFTGAYSQDFDTLPTSGTTLAWSNNSTLSGWSLHRQPAPGTAITTINAATGSSSAGSFYSFGVLGSGPLADRALGGLGSGGAYFGSPLTGAVAGWMALGLTNDTGAQINTLSLGYDGEQWRDGGNTSPQTMTLEYGFGNSFTTVPTWTAPGGSFDFTAPIHTAAAAALDGNAASNRAAGLGGTLNNLGWTAGNSLWVRWVENNDAGNDHALAIDNVQFGLPVAFFGDFNADGSNDAADYVVWRDRLGSSAVPAYSGADGDGDGTIDEDDYGVWRAHFGQILPPPGAASGLGAVVAGTVDASGQSTFEIAGEAAVPAGAVTPAAMVGTKPDVADEAGLVMPEGYSPLHNSVSRTRAGTNLSGIAERGADDLVLLLAIDRLRHSSRLISGIDERGQVDHCADDAVGHSTDDKSIAIVLAEWRWVRGDSLMLLG